MKGVVNYTYLYVEGGMKIKQFCYEKKCEKLTKFSKNLTKTTEVQQKFSKKLAKKISKQSLTKLQ